MLKLKAVVALGVAGGVGGAETGPVCRVGGEGALPEPWVFRGTEPRRARG